MKEMRVENSAATPASTIVHLANFVPVPPELVAYTVSMALRLYRRRRWIFQNYLIVVGRCARVTVSRLRLVWDAEITNVVCTGLRS